MRNNGRRSEIITVCTKYFHTWKKLYEYLTTKDECVYFIVKSNWLDTEENIHIEDFERMVFRKDILSMEENDLKKWIDTSENLLWFTVEPFFETKD